MIYPWHKVPDDIRADLLQSSTGRRHVHTLAVRVFEACEKQSEHKTFLATLGAGLLSAAWEEDPLQLPVCMDLEHVDKSLGHLDPAIRQALHDITGAMETPDGKDGPELQAIIARRDFDALAHYVDKAIDRQPKNIFWIAIAMQTGVGAGKFAWLEKTLARHEHLPGYLYNGFMADITMLQNDPATAATLYAQAYGALPLLIWKEREGYALHRLGKKDEARACWDMVLASRPWHTLLWLVRDSDRRGLDVPGDFPEGPGVVLLYTWNGAEKIDQTLEALAQSEWPEHESVTILVADNGSTDGKTPAILEKWERDFAGRMRVLRFPCNIGAPAARNWLMMEPESRSAEWIAYLDDDLLVPRDWLRYFGTIMRAMPEHGVYGCAVLRNERPWCLQGADMHLLPPSHSAGPGGMPEAPVHLQAASWGEEQNNFGQFDYSRPCIHVSGCCHIFRREALDRAGGFDVRFSPSQVDDFEHDIRMVSKGDMPCYHGALKVRHMHATGLTTAASLPKAMNAYANHLKLQSLYPRPQFDQLRERNLQVILQDVIRRQR